MVCHCRLPYLLRSMQATLVPNPNLADGKPVDVADTGSPHATVAYVDAAIAGVVLGGSDRNYVFTQASPSTVWTVNHNLGKFPAVSVVDSTGTRVHGDEQHVSVNQTVLTFVVAFSGKAYCN